LFFLTALLIFSMRPIDDCDILTQINLGYLGFEKFVKSEPLIYWKSDQVIPNPGWLAQLTFATVDKMGGLSLVRFVYAALLASCFTLMLIVTLRSIHKNYSVVSYFFGGFFGVLIILSNSSARPQGFSLFCCALLFCLHYSNISYSRKLILLTLIGLAWQNFHPSLPVGILIYGILSLQDFKKERLRFWLLRLFPNLAILTACCFLTPEGFSLLKVSYEAQSISRLLGISEWLPAWSRAVMPALMPFYFFLFLGSIFILLKNKSFKIVEYDLFVVFSALTLYTARFSFYLGLMAVPFFVKMLEQIRPNNFFEWYPNESIKKSYFIRIVLILAAIFFCMTSFQNPLSSFYPRKAIAALKNYPDVERIFNYREYAGALNYWGDKKWKLFIDGRLYLYPPPIWDIYQGIALGDKDSLEKLFTDYRADALFLRKSYFSGFLRAIEENNLYKNQWRKIYEDSETVIFVSNNLNVKRAGFKNGLSLFSIYTGP